MAGIFTKTQGTATNQRKVKTSFDFDTEEGRDLAKDFAASNGISLNELINTLIRKAIFSTIVTVYSEDEQPEMLSKLSIAFPDKKNLSGRAFMGKFEGLGTDPGGLKLYTHDNFMEIWKVMQKCIPCGRWEPVKLGDPNAPAGSFYRDAAGNYFDENFNYWNKNLKTFGCWGGHMELINRAFKEETWIPNDPTDFFWDIHVGTRMLHDVLFTKEGISRGWIPGMKETVYHLSQSITDPEIIIEAVYGRKDPENAQKAENSDQNSLINSSIDPSSLEDDETARLLRLVQLKKLEQEQEIPQKNEAPSYTLSVESSSDPN